MNPAKRSLSALFLFLAFPLCSSIDIIAPNQSLKDGDVLVSGGHRYALGFFSPGNSTRRYMGIRYHKVSEQTVVWVANRDNPVNGTSGVLAIDNQASGYRKFGPCRPGSPKMTQEPEPFSLALNQVGSRSCSYTRVKPDCGGAGHGLDRDGAEYQK
ncbi:G-type lectin S-receptor-like serine/threonine-protein kinase RKS1 [Populus alba x Populus x berolinensis]|nr:G-type lectin S-receptor-like serine/threonine-protein kinase RKS1 [Populus alba x Populus x berolinensis]